MRNILLLAFALPAFAAAQNPDPSLLPGDWRATGRYYEVKLRQQLPPLRFELTIDTDLTLSGQVGDATIMPSKPRSIGERIAYLTSLSGPVTQSDLVRQKVHVEILITDASPGTLTADFHLKSRETFDWTMRPGEFRAIRVER